MSADLRAYAYSFFHHRPHVAPVEWCEEQLSITRGTLTPGPFSTFSHTHTREPLNCFGDTTTTDLVLCWGTQLSKSTTLAAGTLYRLKNRPMDALIVFPNQRLADSFAENRLTPLFESSEELRALKPADPDRFKKAEWQLTTATLALVGGASPANLSSRPVGLLVADEINKLSCSDGYDDEEASPLDLAIERTKAYEPLAKRAFASTPTVENDGAIWDYFLRGTQEYRWAPCPHCGGHIRLLWEQVKWDPAAKDPKTEEWDYAKLDAHYVCQLCGGRISDAEKVRALRAAEWRPANPRPLPGWRSFHLSSLYASNLTWRKLAEKFLTAQEQGLAGLQNWRNGWLAEPWGQQPTKITEENLKQLLGTNERGTYDPTDGGTNLLVVDIQRAHMVWSVRRFFRGTRSHLVDWGEALGYDRLDEIFAKYQCHAAGLDSSQGSRAQEVYEQVAARPGKWIAIKGQSGRMQEFFRLVFIDPYTGKSGAGQMTIPLLHVSDEHWTNELLARLDGTVGAFSSWKLTKEIDLVYQRQITGVKRVERKKKNGEVEILIRPSPPIDLFDTEKYALALASLCGLTGPANPPPPGGDKDAYNETPEDELVGSMEV